MALTKPRAHQLADISFKTACRAVVASNVNLVAAPTVVDGVSLAVGNRLLLVSQTLSYRNGIYRVVELGTGSNGVWERTTDADNDNEIRAGMVVYVTEGNNYADTQWKLVTDGEITVGTTGLTFERISTVGVSSIAVGSGLARSSASGDVTISVDTGVLTTLTTSQTLTNKTLTSPIVNSPTVSGGTVDNTVIGGSTPAAGNFTSGGFSGNATVGGNLTVNGDLAVNGTTTTINTITHTVRDPIITLGGAATTDDNKDRGIEFRWNNGSATKTGFFGFDDSTGYFTFVPDASNSSEVFSGTKGTISVTNYDIDEVATLSAKSITGNGSLTVDSWDAAVYRSAKYEYQITQGTSHQFGEIRIYHDGTTATLNEYGTMGSELTTFTANLSNGNVELGCTVSSTSTVKIVRKLIVK